MAKTLNLTDLQLILLSTAAARDDGNVFPLNACIKDKIAEVAKAVALLLKHAVGMLGHSPEALAGSRHFGALGKANHFHR